MTRFIIGSYVALTSLPTLNIVGMAGGGTVTMSGVASDIAAYSNDIIASFP